MKNFYKLFATCFMLAGIIIPATAQQNTLVTGKVIEKDTDQAVQYATVLLKDPRTEKNLTGATTNVDGSFTIKTTATDFYVEVRFMGFHPLGIRDFAIENGQVDLGTINLVPDSEMLDELVVTGEKSQTVFELDKRVFNVGKDLSSTGASALEVLNNVPSVNVNIEGQISLRGSAGVEVLINGKPSILTSEQGNALGTITANMIEKIEVITNPSAKYDAEGTSGIINIVLKKEERKGTNGSFTINTGVPHNHSFGLSLNHRTEKLNLFSQLGAGYRELPNDVRAVNRNLVTGQVLASEGEEFRNENFYNVILGTDYYINPYNVITVSGNFAYEIEDQPSDTRFRLTDRAGNLISDWARSEVTEATNPKWQYEVQYKREHADDDDHLLLFSAQGSYFGKDQSSEFNDVTISGDDNSGQQLTRTNFKEAENTIKLDYTRPLSNQFSVETGAQYLRTDVSNDFAVSDLVDGEWVGNEAFTNVFEYEQQVIGVYGSGAWEGEKWGIKAGLRLEHTLLNTLLVNTRQENNQDFANLFPSFHTSYKVTDNYSLQAGYSRRVRRPRLWDLNPFFNIRNNFNIRMGNPNLLPEFTDSYEFSSIYDKGDLSLSFSVYHRYSTAVVERVSRFEDNVNITMPMNIGTSQTTGLEANVRYDLAEWVRVNGDFNYNYFNRQGELEGASFDFNANQWTTKVTTRFKLPADVDFEVTGQYESAFQTVQGNMAENYFFDMGFRKKIMKSRGVINFSVRDIFATRIMQNEIVQENFTLFNRQQRGRFVTLGFSYGFGKGEAMEFSGRKRF